MSLKRPGKGEKFCVARGKNLVTTHDVIDVQTDRTFRPFFGLITGKSRKVEKFSLPMDATLKVVRFCVAQKTHQKEFKGSK